MLATKYGGVVSCRPTPSSSLIVVIVQFLGKRDGGGSDKVVGSGVAAIKEDKVVVGSATSMISPYASACRPPPAHFERTTVPQPPEPVHYFRGSEAWQTAGRFLRLPESPLQRLLSRQG